MSHSPKNVKGGLFGFINIHSVAKFQKTRRRKSKKWKVDSLATKKIRKKVAQCQKKPKVGDSLDPSGFVGFLEKVKNERGTLWIKFALALGGFRIVSKKWTDQCEDCSLNLKGKRAD